MKALLITIFSLFSTMGKASPEKENVEISAFVNKALATSNDEITLTVDLRLAKEYKNLEIPEFASKIDGLRIVQIAKDEIKEIEDGAIIKRRTIHLKADISGTYIIPKIIIEYEDSSTQNKLQKATSDIFIEIKPQEEAADKNNDKKKALIDIKGIEKKPVNYWLFVAIGTISLLIILLLVFFLKRKKQDQATSVISSHELALADLKALSLKLAEQEQGAFENRLFYFQLSNILRTYIEASFHFAATDQTIEEISKSLEKLENLPFALKNEVKDILLQADLVKFAKLKTEHQMDKKMLQLGIDFVEKTMPKIQEEESEHVI